MQTEGKNMSKTLRASRKQEAPGAIYFDEFIEKGSAIYMLKLEVEDVANDVAGPIHLWGGWSYCDVFTTLRQAVSMGKMLMKECFRELKGDTPDYKKKPLNVFVNDMCDCDKLRYTFTVVAFDPNAKRHLPAGSIHYYQGGPYPYSVEWHYDYLGNLFEAVEWYGAGFERMPGDEDEEAGTHFAVGDFVTAGGEDVYIVRLQPGRKDDRTEWPKYYWENNYLLNPIDDVENDHIHVHEAYLRRYDGNIPEDHPIHVVRRSMVEKAENERRAERSQ
jgi:hypothetical protein